MILLLSPLKLSSTTGDENFSSVMSDKGDTKSPALRNGRKGDDIYTAAEHW